VYFIPIYLTGQGILLYNVDSAKIFVVPCFVLPVCNNLNNIIFKVEDSKVNECDIQNSAQKKAYFLSINLSLDKHKRGL